MNFEKMSIDKSKEKPKKKKFFLKTGLAVVAAGIMSQAAESGAADNIKGTAEKIGETEKTMRMTQEQLSELQGKLDFAENSNKKAPVIGGKALERINNISDPNLENVDDSKVRIARGVKSKVVENFNSLSNKAEAPKAGLAQEILFSRDVDFLKSLSKIHPGWENKPASALLSLLNEDPGIETGSDFNPKVANIVNKINVFAEGINQGETLGDVIEEAVTKAKQMNSPLNSEDISLVLTELEKVKGVV